MASKYWTGQASKLIKTILKEAEITQTEAAELLEIQQSSFAYKLSKGTFRLPEFLELLEGIGFTYLILDANDLPIQEVTEEEMNKLQKEIEKTERELRKLEELYRKHQIKVNAEDDNELFD